MAAAEHDVDEEGPGPASARKKHHDNMIIIVIGVAGVILTYLLYRANRSQGASTSSSPVAYPSSTGTVAGSGYTSDPYTEQMVSQLAGQSQANGQALAGLQQLISGMNLQATAPPPGGTPVAPSAPAPAPSPFNPYPVGTTVAPGEQIVQSLPWGTQGFVDVTNMGGLYTPGGSVSGSAYSGKTGQYSAAVQGNQIYEYTPTGVKQFSVS